MGLFSKPYDDTKLIAEISALSRKIAELKAERDALQDVTKMEDEYRRTRKELTDLQIQLDREKEKHEKEKREISHKVGLHKKSTEFEVESAKREAIISVREENLQAAQDRFQEQMDFQKKQFDQQFAAMKDLFGKIIERMPETRQLISVGSGSRNGKDDD